VNGERRMIARLASVDSKRDLVLEKNGAQAAEALLRAFLDHKPEPISKPKELAERLARLTHLIRDIVVQAFETDAASPMLRDLYKAFSDVLVPELSVGAFADMFAQTIAYGLFAARVNHSGPARFRRQDAAGLIPKTNPFLRKLFGTITGPDLDDEPFVGLVDDLAQLLADTDIGAVLAEFGRRTKREDPIVHFYETFLAAYDPQLRKSRGVYYTPEPVVSYIVRSVDYLLQTRFGCANGLAETATVTYKRVDEDGKELTDAVPRVLVLDPACGTGTFLYAVVDLIREQFMHQDNAGKWPLYVRENLLKRLCGFELLMAPYAVAHLKLGMQLAGQDLPEGQRKDWGCDLTGDDRLGVYLTNTLEESLKQAEVMMAKWVSDEANAAAEIKRDLPIMVVLGNPPYAGHSANKGPWIRHLVDDYKKGCPELHKPAQAKWLQDDYVKFIRFGQWRIQRTGAGILAFITNHSYLDSPTFRGMREQLRQTFDDIYVLDLHGNSKKKERCPDGSLDGNVFDIQLGVAIVLLVKEPGSSGVADVHHCEIWGSRENKYAALIDTDVSSTKWATLPHGTPTGLFVPQDTSLFEEYDKAVSIPQAMNQNGDPAPGIVTTQDQFAISWTREEAMAKVRALLATGTEGEARQLFALCTQSQWNYERAKKEMASGGWINELRQVLYRPLDVRWTVFNSNVAVHRRLRVMRHLLQGNNLALITSRLTKGETFRHAQVTRRLAEVICMSPKTSNNGFVFPLYLYPPAEGAVDTQAALPTASPWPEGKDGRRPNLEPKFVDDVAGRLRLTFVSEGQGDLKATFGPEDVFHYIYAVLHSPTYRTRYAEFLKADFPRIPLTLDLGLFRTLVEKGRQLVGLHLLESQTLSKSITSYPTPGPNVVDPGFPRYVGPGEPSPPDGKPVEAGRVYINKGDPKAGIRGQYFQGVPRKVWEFWVGGYQPCQKWLKDRRGRTLSNEDIEHYEKMVVAINETIRLMAEIDAAIPKWPID
jgi:predicted helicase